MTLKSRRITRSGTRDLLGVYREQAEHVILSRARELALAQSYVQARLAIVQSAEKLSSRWQRCAIPSDVSVSGQVVQWRFHQLSQFVVRCRELSAAVPKNRELRSTLHKLEPHVRVLSESRDMLVRCNLRIVMKLAQRYRGLGVSFLDLIQEGNAGLLRAVDSFDPYQGNRFLTYAAHWVRREMEIVIAYRSRLVHIPVIMQRKCRLFRQNERSLSQPKADASATSSMSPKKGSLDLRTIDIEPISLDSPLSGESGISVLGFYACHNDSPERRLLDVVLREIIIQAVQALKDPKKRTIICMRFGLGHDREYTLHQIGKRFGVSRERIRQLEAEALTELREGEFGLILEDLAL